MFENTLEIVEYPSKGGSKYTEVTELERVLDQIQDSAILVWRPATQIWTKEWSMHKE